MEPEPRSLKTLFAHAEQKRLSLEGSHEPNSAESQDSLAAAIKEYEECVRMMHSLSMFSANERAEDVATSNLPYLLVDAHLADLTQQLPPSSPLDRSRTLRRARAAYERFLHQLDAYDLLDGPQKKLLERYVEDAESFSTAPLGADAAACRHAKITGWQVEKALKAKLAFLRERPAYVAASTDEHDDGSGGRGGGGEGGDEEAVRAVYLADIAYRAHGAFQGLERLNREAAVLGQAPEPLLRSAMSATEDVRRRAESGNDGGYSERLDPRPLRRLQNVLGGGSGPLLSAGGKPLQPFTLLSNRQELAKGVFRPGHNLPTMSIDEYLEEERRRGGIIEGGGEASGRVPEPDEDDMDKADAETMKARAWDDFTESNPRGSGNTLNRG